ncbi:MAG: hypothetical protein PSV35_10795, partial [bacterium]|nr:hypothetical protein [bacterium]
MNKVVERTSQLKAYMPLQKKYLFSLFTLILSVYLCISYTVSAPFYFHFTKEPTLTYTTVSGYHQLLADAFLHQQLHLRVVVRPELLALADPYDPDLNAPYRILDASFFKGNYYFYFTPLIALLFEMPFKVLSGYYLSESLLLAILCFIGFIFSVYTLRRLCYFSGVQLSKPMEVITVLTLAFGTTIPLLLNNPLVYALSSALSYAFLMMATFFLVNVLYRSSSDKWKLNLLIAGISLSLCFMARPNQLFSCLTLFFAFVFLFYIIRHENIKHLDIKSLFLLVPLVIIGLIMACYNFARFHSLFEFGFSYQLRASILSPVNIMSYINSLSVLFVYLFEPWAINLTFPFIHFLNSPIALFGPAQNGYLIGLFFLPVYWLAIHPLFYISYLKQFNSQLWISVCMFGVGCVSLFIDAVLTGATIRYMVDFLPSML